MTRERKTSTQRLGTPVSATCFLDGFADKFLELLDALVEGGRDRQHWCLANLPFERLEIRFCGRLVHLVSHDVAWTVKQAGIVKFEFLEELLVVIPRLTVVRARHIEEEN